jgi:hypothetical protein
VIAVAPLLFIPLLLFGVSWALLGPMIFSNPLAAVSAANPAMLLLWAYICPSAGQMAFPSIGDDVPLLGGLWLGGWAFVVLLA